MKHVNIIGIVGVPACYGGFETLVEYLLSYKPEDIEYTIFCSSKVYKERMAQYKTAKLRYISLDANGISSIFYDFFAMLQSTKADILLILGVSGCVFLPLFRLFYKKKIIINIDGIEWKRAKWKGFPGLILHLSEKIAIQYADVVVTDNAAIMQYVKSEYHKDTVLIEYGGDQAVLIHDNSYGKEYPFYKDMYAVSVCRIEPENNIHIILDAFSKQNNISLVIVGNWQKNSYSQELYKKYVQAQGIYLLESIYDINKINCIRSKAFVYIHGHSAGGTNPSLVEAMNLGLPVLAYDCVYNRETTENSCLYWKTFNDLLLCLQKSKHELEIIGEKMREIAKRRYTWAVIAEKYNRLYHL
jgi:glycosyltransferase involved in cell wall biosynthesis